METCKNANVWCRISVKNEVGRVVGLWHVVIVMARCSSGKQVPLDEIFTGHTKFAVLL